MLDGAAVDGQLSALYGYYGGVCAPSAVVGCSKSDLTGTSGVVDGKLCAGLKVNESEAAGSVISTGNSLAVEVKRYVCVHLNGLAEFNILKQLNCFAVLCCCECVCERGVVAITDLCNYFGSIINVVAFGDGSVTNVECNCVSTIEGIAGCRNTGATVLYYINTCAVVLIVIGIQACKSCILNNDGVISTAYVNYVSTLISTVVYGQSVVRTAGNVYCVCPVISRSIGKVYGAIVKSKLNAHNIINADTANIVSTNSDRFGNHIHIVESYFNISCGYTEYTSCGRSYLVSVAVDGNGLVDQNHVGSGNIRKQRDCLTVLGCIDRSLESLIANTGCGVAYGEFADLDTVGGVSIRGGDVSLSAVCLRNCYGERTAGNNDCISVGITVSNLNGAGEFTVLDDHVHITSGIAVNAECGVSTGNSTVLNIDVQIACVQMLYEDRIPFTFDLAAVHGECYTEFRISIAAVGSNTNCGIGRNDLTAVHLEGCGNSVCSSPCIGTKINSEAKIPAAGHLDGAAILNQSALNPDCCTGVVAAGCVGDLTLVDNHCRAVLYVDHSVCRSVSSADGHILINGESLALLYYVRSEKSDGLVCLCCCKCCIKSCVIGVADLCLNLSHGSGRLFSVLASDDIGYVYIAVSCTGYCYGSACESTNSNSRTVLPVCAVYCNGNIFNSVVCERSAGENTCKTARNCCCVKSNALNCASLYGETVAAAVSNDTAGCAVCGDSRTVVSYYRTILDSQAVAIVCITNDRANTVCLGSIDINVADNLNVFDNCTVAFVNKAYESSNVVTLKFSVNVNVFKCEVLDLCRTVDRAEETGTNVAVALLSGFGACKVLDDMILTVEDSVEGRVAIVTDIYAPIDTRKVDVSTKCYVYALCVVLSLACIDGVTEEDKLIYIINNVGICFCSFTLEADNGIVDTLWIKAGAVKSNLNNCGGLSGHSTVSLVLGSTYCHPNTVDIGCSHSAFAIERNIAVGISLTNNNGNESLNCVAINNCIVIVGICVKTNTVAVNGNITSLNGNALNGTESETALGIGNLNVFNRKIPTRSVLEEGVEAGTGTILDHNTVGGLKSDCNVAIVAATGEGTAFNSKARIVVGSNRRNEINVCISCINKLDILDGNTSVIVGVGKRIYGNCTVHCLAVTVDGVVETGLFGESYVFGNVSKKRYGLAVLNCIDRSLEGCVVGVINLCLSFGYDILKNALNIFLCTSKCESYILNACTRSCSINSKRKCTVVNDIGVRAEFIVSKYAAFNLGVYKLKRCAVVALNEDLDTVCATLDIAVRCCSARSGDQHTCSLCIDGNVLHRTDNVLGCVTTVVGLDTVGKSRALNGYVLNRTNASGRAGLKHDTANCLVGIALALYVNYKILECGSIPNLDCRSVACVNDRTILDSRIVLNTHTAVSVTSCKSLAAKVKNNCLGDCELICSIVDVRCENDLVAILSRCKSRVKFSLGGNHLLGCKFRLSIDGLSGDVVLYACGKGVFLCLNRKNIVCSIGTKVNFARCCIIIKCNLFRSARVNVCVKCVACNSYRLNVLAALVIGNCSSCTGKSRILDNDFCSSEVSCACAFTEDDTVSCVTDNGKAVNSKALLCGDYSLRACSFADINSKILNCCILFKSEDGVPVVVVNSTGKLNGVTVTVDGYGLLKLGVRTAGCIISAIPLAVDNNVSEDLDYASVSSSLEGFYESEVLNTINLGNGDLNRLAALATDLAGRVNRNDCIVSERHSTVIAVHCRTVLKGNGRITGCLSGMIVNGYRKGRIVENEISRTLSIGLVGLPVSTANDSCILGIDHTLIEVSNCEFKLNSRIVIIADYVDTRIRISIRITKIEHLSRHGQATGSFDRELSACVTLVVSFSNYLASYYRSTCIVEERRNIKSYTLFNNKGVGTVYPIRVSEIDSYIITNDITAEQSSKILCNVSQNNRSLVIISYSCESRVKRSVVFGNLTVLISRSRVYLVKIIGTVEKNVTAGDLNAVNPKLNLCGHIVNRGSSCPFHCPILVSIGSSVQLKIPGDVNVTVDDAADVVKGSCTHNIAIGIKNLDYKALSCISPNFAPDSIATGIAIEVVTLGGKNNSTYNGAACCVVNSSIKFNGCCVSNGQTLIVTKLNGSLAHFRNGNGRVSINNKGTVLCGNTSACTAGDSYFRISDSNA